jgi:Holliday junction DNA helicase RuvA
VLADLGAHNFLQAIQTGDDKMLSKVSGIGAKKAEQIVVQLKHKVGQLIKSGIDLSGAEHVSEWHTVTQALESLNYSRGEVNNAMHYLQKNYGQANCSFDQLLRHALSYLTKQA